MARVLVTGGTGFIGRHLVEHLLRRGEQVRCLIHQQEDKLAGAECVRGDITIPETLTRAVAGTDVVYHLAGATQVVSPLQYKPVNGLGTRNLGQACARLPNPPVLVFLSSLAAAGPTTPAQPRREEEAPAPVSAYGRSKLLGEYFLRQLSGHLPVTVLRPTGVFGPGDPNLLPLFKTARWGINLIPSEIDQQLDFVYVDDLVEALPQAAARGERLGGKGAGPDQGIYFVSMDEKYSWAELGSAAGKVLNRLQVRPVVIPPWLVQMMGRTNDFLARLSMQPTLLGSDKMREALAGSWTCSSEKAKHAWGFTCRIGIAEGFQRTVEWYRRRHWL